MDNLTNVGNEGLTPVVTPATPAPTMKQTTFSTNQIVPIAAGAGAGILAGALLYRFVFDPLFKKLKAKKEAKKAAEAKPVEEAK